MFAEHFDPYSDKYEIGGGTFVPPVIRADVAAQYGQRIADAAGISGTVLIFQETSPEWQNLATSLQCVGYYGTATDDDLMNNISELLEGSKPAACCYLLGVLCEIHENDPAHALSLVHIIFQDHASILAVLADATALPFEQRCAIVVTHGSIGTLTDAFASNTNLFYAMPKPDSRV